MTKNLKNLKKRAIKTVYLLDGNGNKLNRKVRRDDKGLFVINHGMRGVLVKSVNTWDASAFNVIETTRKVDYYVDL